MEKMIELNNLKSYLIFYNLIKIKMTIKKEFVFIMHEK